MWSLFTNFLTKATIKNKPPNTGGWKLCFSASDMRGNPSLSVWHPLPEAKVRCVTLSSSHITPWIRLWCSSSSCWIVNYPTSISLPSSDIISFSKSLVQTLMQVPELPLKHMILAAYGFLALLLELSLRSFALRVPACKGVHWWSLSSGLLNASLRLVFQSFEHQPSLAFRVLHS